MQIYNEPSRQQWPSLLQRPVANATALEGTVREVLKAVQQQGDEAILHYTQQFDKVTIDALRVSDADVKAAETVLPSSLKEAIRIAADNIETFHRQQLQQPERISTMPGVECWRKSVGIERVGLYIPGGTAPLFSTVLMLAIPAKLAGCKEIILCSPPSPGGQLNPAILYAASITGVTKIFRVGGVQAIAGMAYGTASIPRVYKIFGPGNQYVTCAKQLIQQEGIAIDMPAGPSEVAVYADDTANPVYVAADLLSQAEHGPDSQVLVVVSTASMATKIMEETGKQLEQLPRKAMAARSLENSRIIVLADENTAMELLNEYAAEHLILCCRHPQQLAERVINAGSVFLGHYSPESVGDYASGTNHTLPTNGFAKAYSGVSVDSFVKKITFQQLSEEGLKAIGPAVMTMADAEGLEAHARAVKVRLM